MILIADDDGRTIDTLHQALTHQGYTVAVARNGLEAYNHLRGKACRCMVLDLNMPRLSGSELLALLDKEGITIPTVILTGADSADDDELLTFENVVEILHKPADLSDLLAVITKHAEHRTRLTLCTAQHQISGDIDIFDPAQLDAMLSSDRRFLTLTKAVVTSLGDGQSHRSERIHVRIDAADWMDASLANGSHHDARHDRGETHDAQD